MANGSELQMKFPVGICNGQPKLWYQRGVLRLPKGSLLHSLPVPVPERQALASRGQSWPGPGQESKIMRWARPGGPTGARAGAQSHLLRALVGADSTVPLWARFHVHNDRCRRRGVEARRHRGHSTRGGVVCV
eukprot:scaffold22381_cov118-Isochrysis_galbana.AAC.6